MKKYNTLEDFYQHFVSKHINYLKEVVDALEVMRDKDLPSISIDKAFIKDENRVRSLVVTLDTVPKLPKFLLVFLEAEEYEYCAKVKQLIDYYNGKN